MSQACIRQWAGHLLALVLSGAGALALADDCALARQKQEAAKSLEGAARVAAYEDIVRLCADFNTLYNLARAYQGTGEHARALATFDRALAAEGVEPTFRGYALARRAESLLALDRLADALAAVEEARQAMGSEPPDWFAGVCRAIDVHPRRDQLSAEEIARVFSLLESKRSYGVVPRIDLQVHFAFDSAALTAEGREQVSQLAQALARSAGGLRITLVGHTDLRGTAAHNQRLSEQRASAVMQAVIAQQPVLGGQVRALGMGESRPRYPGTSEQDHRLNRRVEVSLEP